MVYSGAQGKLIQEKNLKSEISCQTPFNFNTRHQQEFWRKDPFLFPAEKFFPFLTADLTARVLDNFCELQNLMVRVSSFQICVLTFKP